MSESIKWKNGARCAVALSFDVDGESPWIHRDAALAERPLHMGMGAYGPKTGMPRIMRVLDRYDVKVCFFIPSWIVERYPEMAREARCRRSATESGARRTSSRSGRKSSRAPTRRAGSST